MRAVSRWLAGLLAGWAREGDLGTQYSKDEPSAGPRPVFALANQSRLSENPQGGSAVVARLRRATAKGEHRTK